MLQILIVYGKLANEHFGTSLLLPSRTAEDGCLGREAPGLGERSFEVEGPVKAMGMQEAIATRRSVREYTEKPLSEDAVRNLEEEIAVCNAEGRLSIKLITDEPQAFDSALAHYGKFKGVKNYIVLAGAPAEDLNERCGYFGERLVLHAQEAGLSTCWVALTFKKRFVKKMLKPGEKLALVIALGYGADQGRPHKTKSIEEVSAVPQGGEMPAWFKAGVEAALLAPTAMNQQKFKIELAGEKSPDGKSLVRISSLGGAYSDVDLGIVRLHFELGAGVERFIWE